MKYDDSYDPPAPFAEIVLRNIQTSQRSEKLRVLLDTGADISLLPLSAIRKLKISPTNETVELFGFNESQTVSEIYHLQVVFLGKRITGNYCAIDDEAGILGRDVLNEFSILFDGLKLNWSNQ
ncbi:hypothetical protein BH20ACI4_BH20ACI4_06400 [soil metagenome]